MRRIVAMMVPCTMIVAFGCSGMGYNNRMEKTLEDRRYQMRLDENLQPAVTEGKLRELAIFVRPPKPLNASKEFTLGEVQPGVFDETKSFYETSKTFLHVLARKKQAAKKPAAKGAAPAEPPAQRGPFNSDVVAVLKAVFGDDENIAVEKFKDVSEYKPNNYKRLLFETGADATKKRVEVYLFKQGDYDVALIFVYDPAEKNALSSKIALCLESFAVDARAQAKFVNPNSNGEEEATAGEANF